MLLASTLAHAGHEERASQLARDHFRRGQAEYALMHYDLAISEFEAAYRLQALPALLYNIGRCHAALGRNERAATMYQRYLDLKPDAEDRDSVRAEIERLKAAPPTTAASPPPTNSTTATVDGAPPKVSDALALAPVEATSVPASRVPVWRRGWFWGVLGGAVAVGAGAGVGLWLGLSPRDASIPGSDLGAMEF